MAFNIMKIIALTLIALSTLATSGFAYLNQDIGRDMVEFQNQQVLQNQLDQIIEEQQRQRYEMEYEQNINEMIWQQRQQYRQPDGE
jgi:septal ring factor EnvC (AmiA/AmiB activator)